MSGTTEKFNPLIGCDFTVIDGKCQKISTRHQCITLMPIYQVTSLEELCFEDRLLFYNDKSYEESRMEDYYFRMKKGFWTLPSLRDIVEAKEVFIFKAPDVVEKSIKNPFNCEKQHSSITPLASRSFRYGVRRLGSSSTSKTPERLSSDARDTVKTEQQATKPIFVTKCVSKESETPKPIFGSIDEPKAVFGSIDQRKPVFGSINQRKPVFGSIDQRKPVFGSIDQRKPVFGSIGKPNTSGRPVFTSTSCGALSSNSNPFGVVSSATSTATAFVAPSSSSGTTIVPTSGVVASTQSTTGPFDFTVFTSNYKPFFAASSRSSAPFCSVFSSSNDPRVAVAETWSIPIPTEPMKIDNMAFAENLITRQLSCQNSDLYSDSKYQEAAETVNSMSVSSERLSDVMNFIRSYEDHYGKNHPIFYEGTYHQALSVATLNISLLFVYLHDAGTQNIDSWCRNTLGNPDVIRYINTHTMFWGCDVQSVEGSRVAKVLRMRAPSYMNVIIVKDFTSYLGILLKGRPSSSELISQLQTIMKKTSIILARQARQSRNRLNGVKSSSEKLDEEFEESLLRVQQRNRTAEKEEKIRERLEASNERIQELLENMRLVELSSPRKLPLELESFNREASEKDERQLPIDDYEERDKYSFETETTIRDAKRCEFADRESRAKKEIDPEKLKIQIMQLKKQLAAKKVPPEPEITVDVMVCKIKTNLGKRILTRRFLASDTTEDLYHWIFSQPESPTNFEIVTTYPKRTLFPIDPPVNLREAGITEREVVHVNELHDKL